MNRQKKAWKRNARGLSTDSLWRGEEPVTNPNPVLRETSEKVRHGWTTSREAMERMKAALSGKAPSKDVDSEEV